MSLDKTCQHNVAELVGILQEQLAIIDDTTLMSMDTTDKQPILELLKHGDASEAYFDVLMNELARCIDRPVPHPELASLIKDDTVVIRNTGALRARYNKY